MQGSLSLQERLVVLVVAAILPVSALSVWFALREVRAATLQAQSQLTLAASLAASHQQRLLEAAQQLMHSLATLPGLHALQPRDCAAYFQGLRARAPAYANIGLFDLQGRTLCHALPAAPFNAGGPYFDEALRSGQFVMGPARPSREGRLVVPFAQVLMDGDQARAVVFGSLDLAQASAELAPRELAVGAQLAVLDSQGQLLVERPELGAAAWMQELRRAAPWASADAGSGERKADDGSWHLYAFARTRPVAGQSFVAVVSMDAERVTQGPAGGLRRHLLALAATLLAGMALAWWLVGRSIVRPTKRILGAVRRFEQGRLDMRVPLHSGESQRNEFNRIAAAFNLMAESLQMRQLDLETELGHSRSAYAVLDTVLNSLQEGLVAASKLGQFLMFNTAASRLFALETARVLPEQWPAHFGIYHLDRETLFDAYDLPLARAIRGETGACLLYVRSEVVPEGRLLQCSFQPMHGEGGISGGLMVFSDVTELRRLLDEVRELNANLERRIGERTAELARQEARYRILAEQAPEIVWNVDVDGNVTFLNRAWYELVGGAPSDWLGTGWLERIHPDDLAEVQANWGRSRHSLAPYMGTRRIRARDGSWHATAYRAAPVVDEAGAVQFWVGIDTDITGLKAIEQALRNSNRELEAFSYSVSHDLRAPLGAIAGFSRALAGKVETQLDERGRHYLVRIQAGVEKMEQLIDALLSLAKVARAPVSYAPVDLTVLAREALEGLQMASPGRAVQARVQEGLATQGDARLLRIVLDNLLGNAWKFTSGRPRACITVGQREDGVFFVQDNGVGFDMAYAGKLFAPFQRLHSEAEFPGTGIGLATVQRIVARHRGRAWAESVLGEGATFFFTLGEAAPPPWLGSD